MFAIKFMITITLCCQTVSSTMKMIFWYQLTAQSTLQRCQQCNNAYLKSTVGRPTASQHLHSIWCNVYFEKENKQQIPAVIQEEALAFISDPILTITSCDSRIPKQGFLISRKEMNKINRQAGEKPNSDNIK